MKNLCIANSNLQSILYLLLRPTGQYITTIHNKLGCGLHLLQFEVTGEGPYGLMEVGAKGVGLTRGAAPASDLVDTVGHSPEQGSTGSPHRLGETVDHAPGQDREDCCTGDLSNKTARVTVISFGSVREWQETRYT